ncbi:MAG: D-alanyl-D-alanine carboxypeptidase [Saprospiraceae bacterium]|nr:D-alanyl-D-alanine carboxypeptidase [Saprospiraceae bacterium]
MQGNAFKAYLYFIIILLFFLVSCAKQHFTAKGKVKKALHAWVENPAFVSANIGIQIEEIETGKLFISYQACKNFIPASNIKILTTYAALASENDSILTAVTSSDSNGHVFLIPYGDPTFLHSNFPDQKLFQYLNGFDTIHILENNTISKYSPGWAWEDYDKGFMPELNVFPIYGNNITLLKKDDKTNINPPYFTDSIIDHSFPFRRWFDKNMFVPNKIKNGVSVTVPFIPKKETMAALLMDTLKQTNVVWENEYSDHLGWKKIYSHPVDSVLKLMMYKSDNFLAEQLLINIALTNGVKVTPETSLEICFPKLQNSNYKPRWVDGSGLSRYNLCSPAYLVYILKDQWKKIPHNRILSVFPFGGSKGFPDEFYYLGKHIFAKTGSMSNVFCLSGYLLTKKEKVLAFSVMVNGYTGDTSLLKQEMAKVLTTLHKKY